MSCALGKVLHARGQSQSIKYVVWTRNHSGHLNHFVIDRGPGHLRCSPITVPSQVSIDFCEADRGQPLVSAMGR